jgi:CheY-like chemotaxis protein
MALSRAGAPNRFEVVSTSEEAIQYFEGKGRYGDRAAFPLPRLTFINLHLPQIGGIGLVRWIHQQPALSGVALIVLTGSSHPPDVGEAYAAGANGFIVKPNSIEDLTGMIKTTIDFWLHVTKLPGNSTAHAAR